MTEKNPPVWMQSGTYAAVDDRAVTGLLLDRNTNVSGTLLGLEGGIVGPSDQMKVTVGGSNMNYSVSAGTVMIPAPGSHPPGVYVCYNDGPHSGTIVIETSANPRIDLIVAKIYDQALGDSESAWHFYVKQGTAGLNPPTPTVAAGEVAIQSVKVLPASQNGGVNKITSSQLTTGGADQRQYVSSMGGIHYNAGGPRPPHSPGRIMYNSLTSTLWVSNGSAWSELFTKQDNLDYNLAYRPGAAGDPTVVRVARTDQEWISDPAILSDLIHTIDPIDVVSKSPSGFFKVTINSYGHVEAAGNRASVSFKAFNTDNIWHNPSAAHGVSFYATAWGQGSATFLVSVPENTSCRFRMMFLKANTATGDSFFQNNYILVDPVL